MPIESHVTKCPPDHPNRCQGSYTQGQCPNFAMENSKYCKMHGGQIQQNVEANRQKRIYNLSKWAGRVGEIADHDQIKSLREEIGISRVLLEEVVNQCHDSTTLLMYSAKIADLVTRIEKLVSSCHRLEEATGMLLDKTMAIGLATSIVDIVTRYITNEDDLNSIGIAIMEAVVKVAKKKE